VASEILRLSCKSLKIFTKKNIQVRNDEEDWLIDLVLKQPSLGIEALKNSSAGFNITEFV